MVPLILIFYLKQPVFEPMSISFYDNEAFSSVNALIDFEAGTNSDEFFCMGSRSDTDALGIEGEVFSSNIEFNGSTSIHKKTSGLIRVCFPLPSPKLNPINTRIWETLLFRKF